MYFALAKGELAKKKEATTIIIGDSTIWNYSDNSWLNITNGDTIEDISWLDYTVYLDNKKLGNYYLWYNDKWYIFDSNKKSINKEGNLLAFRSNYNIKIADFEVNNIRNYYNVAKVLEENNLSTSSKYTVASEVELDIDNDNNKETLYFISNAFPIDFYPTTIFSIVFILKDGKIETLYKNISSNTTNNGCKPYLSAIIDVDQDNTYELVISCGKYSVEKPIDMLYKLTDDGFKILISNQ